MQSLIAAILIMFLCAANSLANTIYVATNGASVAPFDSWATASTGLQAVVASVQDGDTVIVSNGIYSSFVNSVTSRSTWISVNGPSNTKIVGGNGITLIAYKGSFSGFHFAESTGSYAGVFGFGDVTFSNCYFTDSSSTRFDSAGGLTVYEGTATVIRCVISRNSAVTFGAGIEVMTNSLGVFRDCTISGNTGGRGGGAYLFAGSRSVFDHCVFATNVATDVDPSVGGGGALMLNGIGSSAVNSCTFVANRARIASAVFGGDGLVARRCLFERNVAQIESAVWYGTYQSSLFIGNQDTYAAVATWAQLQNCTVAGNYSSDPNYGVIVYSYGVNVLSYYNYPRDFSYGYRYTNCCYALENGGNTLINCLQTTPMVVDDYLYGSLSLDGSNLGTNFILGIHGISGFALQPSSPCRDAGVNGSWMYVDSDYLGNPRIANTNVDIGFMEAGAYVHAIRKSGFLIRAWLINSGIWQ